MHHQTSFAQSEYAGKKKTTRREKFLAQMEQVVPWARLVAVIAPHYPKGQRGRRPIGLERMLRIYFLQQWYALADEALEDALYDSQALRAFAGIDLSRENVPDATTLLNFRHLLERHDLGRSIFAEVNALLAEKQLLLREGTLIDATILAAPCSTKNQRGERDPAMHQTKKGHQWYFGMKAHIGTDEARGLVHSVEGTAANVSDLSQAHALLHGQEARVGADAGYTGVEKRIEIQALGRDLEWRVAARRRTHQGQPEGWAKVLSGAWEKLKARARAVVEHPLPAPSGAALRAACGRLSRSARLHILKNIFRHRKVRYRGLEKNTAQLRVLFALANLYLVRRELMGAKAA